MEKGDKITGVRTKKIYTLCDRLAQGGMGEIWTASSAHCPPDEPRYAVKLPLPNADGEELKRFEREKKLQFYHPNILGPEDYSDNPQAAIMPYQKGENMQTILKRGSIQKDRAVEYSIHILSALEYLHAQEEPFIHRDVKPANILTRASDHHAFLLDFGVGLQTGQPALTKPGSNPGTPEYQSPEQARPGTVDCRADIYSFGCVLFEMLTGEAAFTIEMDDTAKRTTRRGAIAAILSSKGLDSFGPVVNLCLKENPNERPRNCAEVITLLQGMRPEPPPPPPHWRDRLEPYILRAVLIIVTVILILQLIQLLGGNNAHAEKVVLKVTGSTTIGDTLAPNLARRWFEKHLKASATGCYEVPGFKVPNQKQFHCWGELPQKQGRQVIEILSAGTAEGFNCLEAGDCQVGMASEAAQQYQGKVIGIDGIAVIMNPHDSIKQLSMKQLRKIFCDIPSSPAEPHVTDWGAVDAGLKGKITALVRAKISGTRGEFGRQVCGKSQYLVDFQPSDLTSEAIVEKVLATSGSIGFVSSTLVGKAVPVALKPTDDAPPRTPDALSVGTEEYKLTRRLYLYEKHGAKDNDLSHQFIEWVEGEEGQRVVEEFGFVSLLPNIESVLVPPYAPAAMRKAAEGASRLRLSFQFDSGKDSLKPDKLAEDNLDRVARYIEQHPGTRVIVFGFTDAQPPDHSLKDPVTKVPLTNDQLSERRADAVRKELTNRGVKVEIGIFGFGKAMLIDSSNDQRNRRAEVWIAPAAL